MNTEQMLKMLNIKTKLSTLWIFILLNMIFRDIHEFGRAGFLEEMMSGVVNGTQITEELMLIGGIMIEIPILMVLLSQLLPYRWNRLTNILASVFMIIIGISMGANDLDDIFFLGIEIVALLGIIWYTWRWAMPKTEAELSFA